VPGLRNSRRLLTPFAASLLPELKGAERHLIEDCRTEQLYVRVLEDVTDPAPEKTAEGVCFQLLFGQGFVKGSDRSEIGEYQSIQQMQKRRFFGPVRVQ